MNVEDKKLSENIEKLNFTLERRANGWRVFLTGIISGIGTAIGAALIGAIVVGIIASSINKIPILKD
ncbi:DUF5665 domain-containing protein, partial [Candidatus Dojkabacteria bacterium]|nr:DUF5665 domain-containing protein [Candidatus Dojkabacteria bacterium]